MNHPAIGPSHGTPQKIVTMPPGSCGFPMNNSVMAHSSGPPLCIKKNMTRVIPILNGERAGYKWDYTFHKWGYKHL